MDWLPITDAHVVDAFDSTEVADGYHDGKDNEPRPGANRSAAYRHGWWIGQRDGGHRDAHPADIELVKNMREAKLGFWSPEFAASMSRAAR